MRAIRWGLPGMALVSAGVLACGGCSGPKPTMPSPGASSSVSVQINGDASDPVNKIVISAISDLQGFWSAEFPKLCGHDYAPVNGGFYA